MVHLAYEFEPYEPLKTPLPPPSPLVRLLKGPIMATTQDGAPGLALLDGQAPTLNRDDVRETLDFLGGVEVERLAAQLP